MANPNQSEKSNALDREENITKGSLSAKRVALFLYDSNTDTLTPWDGSGSGSSSATYESRNDTTTDTNLVYLGKALPGSATTDAAWQIKRYNKSAGTMTFADDVTTFTKQWSERTTYGY